MTLIVVLIALYALSSVLEGIGILFSAVYAVMSSLPGTIITVAATAYLTYRWYRARYIA